MYNKLYIETYLPPVLLQRPKPKYAFPNPAPRTLRREGRVGEDEREREASSRDMVKFLKAGRMIHKDLGGIGASPEGAVGHHLIQPLFWSGRGVAVEASLCSSQFNGLTRCTLVYLAKSTHGRAHTGHKH